MNVSLKSFRHILKSTVWSVLCPLLVTVTGGVFAQQTNILTASDGFGATSFNAKGSWLYQVQPGSGTNYFTGAFTLRTPSSAGNYTFAGDSLTISPGGSLNIKGGNGNIITINNLTNSGAINNGINANQNAVLAGSMTVVGGASLNTGSSSGDSRNITNNMTMYGTGTVTNSGVNAAGSGAVIYTGNNTAFTGRMIVNSNTVLQAASQANLGGNPASFNAAQLILDNGTILPTASFSLNNANSGVTINSGGGTFSVGSGLVLTVANPVAGSGQLSKSGSGTLALSGSIGNFTGNTTVSAGTLDVSGMAGGFTNFVGSQLLAGNSGAPVTNINGNLTISGTNNVAGSGVVGAETINGNLNLAGGSLVLDMTSPVGADLISLSGSTRAFAKSGTTSIFPVNGSIANGTYILVTNIASSSVSGSFAVSASPRGTPSYIFSTTPPAVTLTVSGVTPASLVWAGTNGVNWDTTTTNWFNASNPDKFYNGDNVTFDDTGKTNSIIVVGALAPGVVTVSSASTNYTIGGSGSIGGLASVVKSGASTLTITNANTYQGGTTVNGGIVKLGNINALGAPSGGGPLAIVNSGGAIDLNAVTPNSTNAIVIQGNGTGAAFQGCLFTTSGWGFFGGTQFGANNVTLAGDATVGANNGSFFGIGFNETSGLKGNGYNLSKVGISKLFLMGSASSPVASLNILGGQVIFYNQHDWLGTNATVVYNGGSSDTWTPNGGGVTVPYDIIITNFSTSIGDTHGPFGGPAVSDVYNGKITLNNALTFICSVGQQTINGAISGSYGISNSVTAGHVITLTGKNTYTGPTVVAGGGTLTLSTANQGGGSYTVGDSSTMKISSALGYATIPASTLTLGISTGGTLSFAGLTSIPTLPVIAADSLAINGTVTILPPSGGFPTTGFYPLIQYTNGTIAGSGSLVLGGSFGRGVAVNLQTNFDGFVYQIGLNVTGAGVLWTGANNFDWDVNLTQNWSTNSSPTVFFTGDSVLFDDSGNSGSYINFVTNVAPSTVTVNGNNTYTFGQNNAGGNLTGSMSLNKYGSGTLIVANNTNNFTGGTYINGGILQLGSQGYANGAAGALNCNLGKVYVNSGGTLDDNGLEVPNFSGFGPDGYDVYISGTGSAGLGAVVNNNTGNNDNAGVGYLTLAGDASVGGPGDLNMRHGVTPQLKTLNNSYTLSKIGTGSFRIRRGTVDPNLGDIKILEGQFSYENSVAGLGNPTNKIYIGSSGTLALNSASVPLNKQIICSNGAAFNAWAGSGTNNIIAGPVSVVPGASVSFLSAGGSYTFTGGKLTFTNPISIPNGSLNVSGGNPVFGGGLTNISGTVTMTGSSIIGGPVNIPGGSTLQFNGNFYQTLVFSNVLSGSGNFGIQFQSIVKFAASNTFSGNITVPYCGFGSGTHLDLIGNGSISRVPTISLQGITSGQPHAGYIDVSGRTDGALTLFAGQTLQVDNGCKVVGSLLVGPGATLSMPSFNYFDSVDVFNVTSNLTYLPGSTNIMWLNGSASSPTNVAIQVSGNLAYGGVLLINTNGVTVEAGSSFTLFPGASSYSGSFSQIIPSSPGVGLAWNTNSLTVNGTLSVVASSSAPAATNISYSVSGNQLVLNWPSGQGWKLQSQTNGLASGLTTNWNDVLPAPEPPYTNTVSPANPTVFFRLIYP